MWELGLDDGSDLSLDGIGHFHGSGGDGERVGVEDTPEWLAAILDIVVFIISGQHLECFLVRRSSHCGHAGGALEGATAVGELSVHAFVFTPAIQVVEASEIQLEISLLVELELLGDTISHRSVWVVLLSVDLEPVT